jgi:hypothetical protein
MPHHWLADWFLGWPRLDHEENTADQEEKADEDADDTPDGLPDLSHLG